MRMNPLIERAPLNAASKSLLTVRQAYGGSTAHAEIPEDRLVDYGPYCVPYRYTGKYRYTAGNYMADQVFYRTASKIRLSHGLCVNVPAITAGIVV